MVALTNACGNQCVCMSIETGRTDLTFAGRASHAGTPCPNNASDRNALATALAPTPNFTKSRRPTICLFMSHSLKVTFVYYSSLDGRNAFCYVLTTQQSTVGGTA